MRHRGTELENMEAEVPGLSPAGRGYRGNAIAGCVHEAKKAAAVAAAAARDE